MKSVLIYSGNNQRAVVAFCRYAKKASLNFYIIANGEDDTIYNTEHSKNIILTREKNKLSIESVIENCQLVKRISKYDKLIILPSTEFLNRFLLDNREQLLSLNIEIGLCEKNIYETISDKYSFGKLCEKHGINIPKEINAQPTTFPFIVKPKQFRKNNQTLNEKPAIILNQKQLEDYFLSKEKQDYYYQEYIGGNSYYLLYYVFKDGRYSCFSQENLIQQHNGGSIILCNSSDFHKNEYAHSLANLFIENKFFGLVMVEIKAFSNSYYMIEANPRLWGPSQLILDSNMNLFDCFALENDLISESTSKEEYKENQFYFWSGGLIDNQNNKKQPIIYNFEKENFLNYYHEIINNEVYNKTDTRDIFLKENKHE